MSEVEFEKKGFQRQILAFILNSISDVVVLMKRTTKPVTN